VLHGTGTRAILEGYSSAGKTGTAQKIDAATGSYSRSHYIASFTGFAPVNNPAVSVLVILDSPVGPHEGGLVAAPVFSRVMQKLLAYLNVAHDVELLNEEKRRLLRARSRDEDLSEAAPDYLADETLPADVPAPAAGAAKNQRSAEPAAATPVEPSASTTVKYQNLPVPSSPAHTHRTVMVDISSDAIVPDFRGLSLRAALEEAQALGIELEVSGSGIGREQSPLAGAKIPAGGRVWVKFAR